MAESEMLTQLEMALEPLIECHVRLYADADLLNHRIHLVMTLLKQIHFTVQSPPQQDKGSIPNHKT